MARLLAAAPPEPLAAVRAAALYPASMMTSGAPRPPSVPGRVQASQQVVADLHGRSATVRVAGVGALDIDQRGPRGAQVPQRRDELVDLQPGGVLSGVLSQRQASVVDVTAARRRSKRWGG